MKRQPKIFSAATFLEMALEMDARIDYSQKVHPEKWMDWPSMMVRYHQLNVLLQIFTPETFKKDDFGYSLEAMLKGKFLENRKTENYKEVFAKMDKLITAQKFFPEQHLGWETYDLVNNFEECVKFKQELNRVLDFNDGIMELSYEYYYSVLETRAVLNKVSTKRLDQFLATCIDPLGRKFTQSSLIKNYSYPKEDPYEMEIDNF